MLKISKVIEVNIGAILRNWMFFHFVDGQDIEFSKRKTILYYTTKGDYIEYDLTRDQIKNKIHEYVIKAKQNPDFIIKQEKDRTVGKFSFKNFCEENGFPFKTKRQMHLFIINNF